MTESDKLNDYFVYLMNVMANILPNLTSVVNSENFYLKK